MPKRAEVYLEPLIERAQAGVAAVARAVEAGELRIDEELHLTPLAAEEEEPGLVKLRAALDHRIGEAQLPELLLEVDARIFDISYRMLMHQNQGDPDVSRVQAIAGNGGVAVILVGESGPKLYRRRPWRQLHLNAHRCCQRFLGA